MNEILDYIKRFDVFAVISIVVVGWYINSNMNTKFEAVNDKFDLVNSKIVEGDRQLQIQMMDIDRRLCRIEGAYMMCGVPKKEKSDPI